MPTSTPAPDSVIFDKVNLTYGKQVILHNLSLDLSQRRIGIIGANGSGKSSFSRLINGLTLPSRGHVTINGLDSKHDGKAIRRQVGYVFQNPDHQIVMPLVEEDLAFGCKNLRLDKVEIERRITEILSHYNLENIRRKSVHLLSGGQKQLLAICGVLIMRPKIIVFDEPTTLLDLRHKKRIAEVISTLPQQIFAVSHDLQLLENFERILVFDQGQIVCDASPDIAIAFYERLMT